MPASPEAFDLAPIILRTFSDDVAKSFSKNELAYLALTSKVESPIRDRLAFALHTQLAGQGLVVAREWHRVDIAVLRGDQPVALVEIKAMYLYDAFKEGPGYAKLLRDDAAKCRRLEIDGAQILTLLLATHPHREPKAPSGVVKYLAAIRRSLAKHDGHEALAQAAAGKIEGWPGANILGSGYLNGGEAFGASVSVHYWLFGSRSRAAKPEKQFGDES